MRLATVLALGLLLTGCSGPEQRVEFGGKAVPINVAFGLPPEAATPSPGTRPPVLQPAPGGIGVVPVLPDVPVTPLPPVASGSPGVAPPVACPTQDPLRFPQREATNVITDPVPEGTFPYRITGSFTVGAKKTPYTATLLQTVKRLEPDAAGRPRFAMSTQLLGASFTTTYVVQAPVEAVPGELALESTVQEKADGTGATFKPTEPLRLLQLRAEKGTSWFEAGNDPLSASTSTVNGEVFDKARLNACGSPVEAWTSVLTQRTITPGQSITAERTMFFATGYGGLLVGEKVSYSGTVSSGEAVSGESTMTINVDPGVR